MTDLLLLLAGIGNVAFGLLHLLDTLQGDSTRSGLYITGMLVVGLFCIVMSRVRV